MMSVQGSLVMVPINEFGTEAQKQKFLPKLATGEWIGCFGLTEPNYGSDPGGMTTRAQEGRRRLRADRHQDVDHAAARSPTSSSSGPRTTTDEIRGFILEKGWKGLTRAADSRQGRPAHQPHRRDRDGRRVLPRGERVSRTCAGSKGPFTCLNSARYGIAWGALGAAEDCWHRARAVRARAQAVRPAAGRQSADPEEAGRHADRDHARPAGAACASAA